MANAAEIVAEQEAAVAFECARECISDLMGIYTGQIAAAEAEPEPDLARIEAMCAERSRLARERSALRLADRAGVARILTEYGAAVRRWRAE